MRGLRSVPEVRRKPGMPESAGWRVTCAGPGGVTPDASRWVRWVGRACRGVWWCCARRAGYAGLPGMSGGVAPGYAGCRGVPGGDEPDADALGVLVVLSQVGGKPCGVGDRAVREVGV